MAHFRAVIQGNRGETSRLGSKQSGLRVEAQSWEGKVTVSLYRHDSGQDWAIVELAPHHAKGIRRELYRGPVDPSTTPHAKVAHGLCPTCGHHGADCTGTLPQPGYTSDGRD